MKKEDILFNRLITPYNGDYQVSQDAKRRASVFGEDLNFYQHNFVLTPGGGANPWQGYNAGQPNFRVSNPVRVRNNNITIDEFSQWDDTTNELTATFTGNYKTSILMDVDFKIENFFGSDDVQLWANGSGASLTLKVFLRTVKNNSLTYYDSNALTVQLPEGQLYPAGLSDIVSGTFEFIVDFPMNNGDYVDFRPVFVYESSDPNQSVRFRNLTTGNYSDVGIYLNINSTTFDIVPDLEYNVGTPLYINDFVPKNIKQRDFIKGIMDMFKMVVEPDPENENNLIYKTRNKYYDDGVQKDWTDKLAKDKQVLLEWIQDKQSKRLKLTYKEDGDTWNEAYQNAIKETFGQYRYTFENEYNQGEQEMKVIFSPTPILYSEDSRNLYIPAIGSMTAGAKKMNVRILLDNGVRTDGNFNFLDDDGQGSSAETDYPFASHWDDPIKPSIDINFGVSRFYFYQNYTPTFNNLYTLHHQRFVGQLTKGKILTAYFHLTPTDIMNFDRSDKIWIKDANYNVNKIIDYDANSKGLTKVELITVDEGIEMSLKGVVQPPSRPNPGNPLVLDPHVIDHQSETTAMNTYGGGNGAMNVAGERNVIQRGVQGVSVFGDNNSVNRSRSMIIGSGNTDSFGRTMIIGDDLESDGYNRLLVSQGKIKDLTIDRVRTTDEEFRKTKTLEIGGWDMDTDATKNVAHGLSADEFSKIIDIEVMVINDDGSIWTKLMSIIDQKVTAQLEITDTVVAMERYPALLYDSVDYDDDTINRGYITITYIDSLD